MTLLAIAMLMGGILGFAAHRAGICTVKAVAEVLTTRRGWLLWSFAQCALWVFTISVIAGMFAVDVITIRHWPLLWLSVAGGVLFGLGAALNAGCAFSTLSRTVDGNLNVAMAVLCWPPGMAAALLALDVAGLERSPRTRCRPIWRCCSASPQPCCRCAAWAWPFPESAAREISAVPARSRVISV